MSVARLVRMPSSSSTMATLIWVFSVITISVPPSSRRLAVAVGRRETQPQPDGGPPAGPALDGHVLADGLGAAAHVAQAVAPALPVGVKTLAVVLHDDFQRKVRRLGADEDFARG